MSFSHPNQLDKFGCLKPPRLLHWILLFYVKGYLAWIVSLTYSQDRAYLLGLFYPKHEDWELSVLVGFPALIVAVATTFRRPEAGRLLRALWHASHTLLILAWLGDSGLVVYSLTGHWQQFSWGLAMTCIGNFWIGLYLFKSKWLAQSFKEYPTPK